MNRKRRCFISTFSLLIFCAVFLSVISYSILGTKVKALAEEGSQEETEKIVYLTFDDGPTIVTKQILQVLQEEQVTGTFFVIGQLVEQNKIIAENAKNSGNALCVHTYTHEDKIYRNIETFMEDYHKCSDALKGLTGCEVPKFMRFPGGSSTTMARKPVLKEIRGEVVDKGLYYVDWNITIDDSLARNKPVETLVSKFYREFKKNKKDRIVVLMHDSYYNKTTVPALKEIIKALKEDGYVFKNFNDIDDKELKILEERGLINKHEKKLDRQVNK